VASTNKTTKLGLNKFVGTDHLKRDDYNNDMEKLDQTIKHMDEPITPTVNVRELQITAAADLKHIKLKITVDVTGGAITVKKNEDAAKPLKFPNGDPVEELLAETMFFDIYEEAAAFIYGPKSGGLQFADKNNVELKTFSTLETNYDMQLATDELNYREGVTVPRSPYFLTQDYNSKQLVKDYDTGKIYMIARNSANNTVKCVEVNTLTGQLTLIWNKVFNSYPDPDAGVTIYKSELFMMGGSGNSHCIYKINLTTGAIIYTASRLHSTLTSWRIWGDQREKGKPIIYDGSTQAGAGIWKLNSNTVGGGFTFGYLNSSNGFSGPVSTDPNGNYWTHGYTYGYKISPSGTMIRQWSQAGYSASGRGYANVFNPNTNKYYAFAPLNNTNINQTRLGVFDDQGNEISRTDYTNRDCGYQGKAMYDGEYIVYNFSWNWGSVMKVDANGNYIWDTKSTEGGPVISEVKTTLWAIVLSETKQVVYCCNAYSDSNDIFRMQILEQASLDGYKPKVDGGKRLILNAAVATTFLLAEDGNKNNFKSFKSSDVVNWSPTLLIKPESLAKLEKYLVVK